MPTSLHIPKALLSAVDRRARKLKMSRNRFVVRTLEQAVATDVAWSPGFFDALRTVEPEDAALVSELLDAIVSKRTRKGPPAL
jgi:hypothetical protein